MSGIRALLIPLVAAALLAGTVQATPAAAAAAGSVPAAGSATAAIAAAAGRPAGQVRFTVGTHNVKHATGTVNAFADVIGWQELDRPVGWAAARNLAGYRSYLPAADPGKEDAISWNDTKFELVGGHSRLTHHGQAKVTPNRYVNWVVLRHRNSGLTVAFVNTHFISGAWNKHPNRQQRWLLHQRVLQEVVADLHQRGLPVVVVGDMNRQDTIDLAGTARVPVGSGDRTPIDQLYVSRGHAVGAAVRLSNFGSDHPAYRAVVTFPKPKAASPATNPPVDQPTTEPPVDQPATEPPPADAEVAAFLALLTRLAALLDRLRGASS